MSVGTLGNRSQPDDFMSHLLYQIFNEPMVTMRALQKLALVILLLQVCYIFFLRSKTMIPLQILNFLICTLYIYYQLLYTEDFKKKTRLQQHRKKRMEDLWLKRTANAEKNEIQRLNELEEQMGLLKPKKGAAVAQANAAEKSSHSNQEKTFL